nr:carboxypeptidase regulatory-like domain-containing protein [uncultured Carboxylicivirga sp.]
MKKILGLILTFVGVCFSLYLAASPILTDGINNKLQGALTQWFVDQTEAVQATESVESIPYFEGFDDESTMANWTVNDNNQDGSTWAYRTYGGWDETECAAYSYGMIDGDDWLFSPSLELYANKQYKLSFYYNNIYETQSLKVFVGDGVAIENQTIELVTLPSINGNGTAEVSFSIPADGNYNLGFYCYSVGGAYSYLYLDNVEVTVAALREAPAVVSDLVPVPGENGAQTMALSWTNPSTNFAGDALTEISSIEIYKDGATTPILFTDNLTPGADVQWNDDAASAGEHTYKVVVSNLNGAGLPAEVSSFVGVDLPQGPETVEATRGNGTINLTWSNPAAFGLKGGWYRSDNLTYRIVRQPGNVVLETAYSGNSYEDQTISSLANYNYEITTKNQDGTGGTTSSNYLRMGNTVSLPFTEDWEDASTFGLWTVLDANEDGYTFHRNLVRGNELPSCIGIETVNSGPNQDDWFFTPSLSLEESVTYRLSFTIRTGLYASESFDISIGKTSVPSAQSYPIRSYEEISTDSEHAIANITFEAPYTGNFNLGFHVTTQGGGDIFFDDFTIEKVVTQDLAAVSVKGNTAPTIGQTTTNTVSVVNNGSDIIRNYTIQLIDNDNNVLAESFNSRSLGVGSYRNVELEWVPTEVGPNALRVNIVSDTDEVPGNNQSKPYNINVQNEGSNVVTVGEDEMLSYFVPIYPYIKAFSESVYVAENFDGNLGQINAIAYKVVSGANDLHNQSIQVFIGETEETTLKNGWIPSGDMQLVVDRKVEIPWGVYDWKLDFDTPYQYKGGNIVILVRNSGATGELGEFGLNFLTSYALSGSSRYVNSYNVVDPENPSEGEGQFLNIVPNAMFYFDNVNTGNVTGHVYAADGVTPLEGATVAVDGFNQTVISDVDGLYEFTNLQAGDYNLTASLIGYSDAQSAITVTQGNSTTANFNLNLLPLVTVSGKVAGSDLPSVGIANVDVHLSGYADYTTTTDAEGNFTFENIYGDKSYDVSAESAGYEPFAEELSLTDVNVDNYSVVLTQQAAQPLKVYGVDRNADALISWDQPVLPQILTKGSGNFYGIFGSNGSAVYSIGHRYRPEEYASYGIKEGMAVTKIRFYANAVATFNVKVWQGDNNAETTVYSQTVTPLKLDAWNEVELNTPVPIDLSRNLVVGVEIAQVSGIAPVAYDEGPFNVNGDAFYNGQTWTTAYEATGGSMNANWCLEAVCGANANDLPVVLAATPLSEGNAVVAETTTVANDSVQAGYFTEVVAAEQPMQTESTPVSTEAGVNPIGYNVYRLLNGDEHDETTWVQVNTELIAETSFVDNSWQPLENDIYRYAVKSVYANEVLSEATFSNGIDKGKYAVVSATVSTNGGSSEGATVELTNNQFSYSSLVEADGTVAINDVYFGTYTLRITKKGYRDYEVSNVEVNTNEVDLGSFLIEEDTRPARNVTVTDLISSADVSWEAPNDYSNSWIHKDNGQNTDGMGLNDGGVMEVGVRYTPEELQFMNLNGFAINKIRLFPTSDGVFSLKVWEGAEGYESEIYSQDVEVTLGEWNEISLDAPVALDVNQSYVIGYAVNHSVGSYPCGYDAGPGVVGGDVIKYGGVWYRFTEVTSGLYDLNWNIQAYCMYGTSTENDQALMAKSGSVAPATIENTNASSIDLSSLFSSNPAVKVETTQVEVEPYTNTYDVYRLAEADKEVMDNWVLLTSNPIADLQFTDESWGDLTEGNFVYAVVTHYHAGNYSVPVFSDVITKGAVSLVTLNVATNNTLSAENATVTLTGTGDNAGINYSLLLDVNGEGEIIEVPKGTYTITVVKEGYQTIELIDYSIDDDFEVINSLILNEEVTIPLKVEATNNDASATINWMKPGSYLPQEGWMYWDSGESTNSIGNASGIVFSAAQRFTPDDLVSFRSKGLSITKISFYYNSEEEAPSEAYFQVRVWLGEDPQLVYYQDVENPTPNAWNEVVLDAPVYINGSEEVWVGYECDDRAGYPAGVDAGPAIRDKGAKIFTSGDWYNLTDVSSVNANWSIHAYCEEVEGTSSRPLGTIQLPESQLQATLDLSLSNQPLKNGVSTHSEYKLENDKLRFVNGYQVWRLAQGDESNESAWTLLTTDAITETSYTDTDWANLEDDIYVYAVKAIYESGLSEAGFSNAINTISTGIDTGINDDLVSIYPVPNNGNFSVEVENEATITISNLKGGIVYKGELIGGKNDISINVSTGVYLVQITNDKVNISRKIIIE